MSLQYFLERQGGLLRAALKSGQIFRDAADVIPGQAVRVPASDGEVRRLGESAFCAGPVSEEAMQDTCLVLARMADLYRKMDVVGVRAAAPSAIRDTRNQRAFLERARRRRPFAAFERGSRKAGPGGPARARAPALRTLPGPVGKEI
jgi:hypothetical protein